MFGTAVMMWIYFVMANDKRALRDSRRAGLSSLKVSCLDDCL